MMAPVPRLWNQTIEAHRREVSDAIVDATARLVANDGLLSVTMSRIAEATGIGRATLYKYFADVEAILRVWHERQIARHLEQLATVRDEANAYERLEVVLEAYALIRHEAHAQHDTELGAALHRDRHVRRAERELRGLLEEVLAEGARSGQVREDIALDELATYCASALAAASNLRSKAAVRRLVGVTLAGLRPLSG